MKNGPGPTINPMAANDLVTLQARPKITLIYKPSTMGAISVRPARADCSLADLMIQASSCWTIPLEEVKLFGKFDGLRVQLIGEGDFDGYIGVCLSHNEKIVVEVEREYMGGNHRNNSNAGLGAVGTIGGIRTHS